MAEIDVPRPPLDRAGRIEDREVEIAAARRGGRASPCDTAWAPGGRPSGGPAPRRLAGGPLGLDSLRRAARPDATDGRRPMGSVGSSERAARASAPPSAATSGRRASAQAAPRRASRPPNRASNASTSSRSARQASDAAPAGAASAACTPREIRPLDPEVRHERVDLAQRDAAATLQLERRAARRRLAAVTCDKHERLRDVVAVRHRQQARPEVVILALAKRGVVAQPVAIEDAAVDDHGRVEEGRGEERRPADRAGAARHPVHRPSVPSPWRSIIPVPTTARPASERMRAEDMVDPAGERDVVSVHPRDVPAAGPTRARR